MLARVVRKSQERGGGGNVVCPGTFFRQDAIRFERGGLTHGSLNS